MPELRQNPATKEWVVISTERAMRPNQMGKVVSRPLVNEKEECPFCPGHENMTPNEIVSYRIYGTAPNSPGWRIRIIPNKYAALVPKGDLKRAKVQRLFPQMNGIGEHEVIIESPEHEKSIAVMDQKQVEEIFLAYRERYMTLSQNPKFEMIIIFKNHGFQAGTSLRHPHSQLIATPITPMHIRHRIEEAMRYFDDNGDCVYCEMIKAEKRARERVILETDNFITFEPFASKSPFETWVIPKIHKASFEEVSQGEVKELAYVMKMTLAKIYKALEDPDFNYMIFSSPCHEKDGEYYHWYIQILPRVSAMAGFELGSGIYINTMPPETAAKLLRGTSVE
ncbi:hypothetical protein AMJ44_07195 [candidate division WOR-1 bacterium DG_54_3]|uniref:Galactose-1-phosphate uridylyltransferase n=1 Tax=candidate division WOR-1 bacterium DG_54_3 TaxID=1703775 RepID=A0A0S7XZD5_UNCSA|nr:MAG: hypothetical protein AMJ44_07195 [candidate division WOR-1 bacterium DG_54_3]